MPVLTPSSTEHRAVPPPAGSGARAAYKVTDALDPIPREQFGETEARHLLLRAGFGGTPQQVRTLAEWGPERAVDSLLNVGAVEYEPVRADQFSAEIMAPPTEEERRMYREAQRARDEDRLARFRLLRQEAERADRMQVRDVQRWWLTRMIESPRPLEEKMTLFWHGHFATSYRTIENSYHMFLQNQLFRRHALGNYGELLFAIIRDPAMLAYLDNNDSRKNRPNENLARELMELFSLGEGNYTENDIKQGARALTGYTFEGNQFVFRRNDHDTGNKRILGREGDFDGDGFVRLILEQRACSRFMTRKFYRFLAADLPATDRDLDEETEFVLGKLASTFLREKYDVKPVLRQLFLSRHFYSARVVNQQIKSPADLVVGAVRSLHAPTRDLGILLDAMDLMGQNLLFPPSVKGWDGGRSWINTSTLFVRQNILAFLLTGRKPQGYDAMAAQERFDTSALASLWPASEASDTDAVIRRLLWFCLGHVPEHALEPLRAAAAPHGADLGADALVEMLLLITAMPEYQLC